MSEEKAQNPLKQFYRSPKLYVNLPSRGKFNEVVDKTITGEIPVFAMTSKDELLMKNPDALLNGDAVVEAIKSCAPNIKNPKELPVCDIDLLLIAIRMATFGEFMEAKLKSPHTNKLATYDINLNNIVESVGELPAENNVTLKNGCTVYVKPFTYDLQTQINLVAYDQATALKNVGEVNSATAKQFKTMFSKLAEINTDVIAKSIYQIKTPDGEVVNDVTHIREFLANLESTDSKIIDGKIDELNASGTSFKQEVLCKETEKPFEADIKLDPSDFFVSS
tara:strand:- start:5786 stop:6622 length:837 start_codon:yes stop_codon:yes gene_type:complete